MKDEQVAPQVKWAGAGIEPVGQISLHAQREVMVKRLGVVDYLPAWRAMQAFTTQRGEATADELWLVQHPPVYTLGLAGKREHLLRETAIPVIKVDRGGQITYHGPGQIIAYLLLDLRRLGIGVRQVVQYMEQAVIELLADYGMAAERQAGAPGVYVNGAKIAALGLRVRHGCCYHGLALNCDLDLEPFAAINPCGYPGLRTTQLRTLGVRDNIEGVGEKLAAKLLAQLRLSTLER